MLQIAHLSFTSPLVLAPLAGYSDLPFRLLCRKYGAGYCVSEMISCHGLVYQQPNTLRMLSSTSQEKPVAFQLFGADPDVMGEAAAILASYGPSLIDINMGCPVRKVTKRGAGAALMTDLALAEKIIKAVVDASAVPVTVKFRLGKDRNQINCLEFGRMVEASGAVAMTLHGRTWAQGFGGESDWLWVARLKQTVSLPVLGNGDIQSAAQAEQKMVESGCDGVMIGRGALGNPWVFSASGRPESVEEILTTALEHLHLLCQYLPAERMLGHVKSQLSRYFREFRGSSFLRKKIFELQSIAEIKALLQGGGEGLSV